jgi:hypothetical protein
MKWDRVREDMGKDRVGKDGGGYGTMEIYVVEGSRQKNSEGDRGRREQVEEKCFG